MFDVKCDSDKQRLDIVADQALSAEEFQTIISAIQSNARQLSPGFVVAVDFRGMWVDDPFLNERFKLLQEALLDCGARKIGTLIFDLPILQPGYLITSLLPCMKS